MTTIARLRGLARQGDCTAAAEGPCTTAGGSHGAAAGTPGVAGGATDARGQDGPPMVPPRGTTACRDLAEEYLEAFRSTHPHLTPPSVVVLRDGRLLFNGFILSAEDVAEMRANLLRWHQPLARAPRDN